MRFPHQSHPRSTARRLWYPPEDRDCRVVRVQVVAAGLWMTTDDGQTVLIGPNEERRRSRDMRWHICLAKDLHNNLIVQCLFEPANSLSLEEHWPCL